MSRKVRPKVTRLSQPVAKAISVMGGAVSRSSVVACSRRRVGGQRCGEMPNAWRKERANALRNPADLRQPLHGPGLVRRGVHAVLGAQQAAQQGRVLEFRGAALCSAVRACGHARGRRFWALVDLGAAYRAQRVRRVARAPPCTAAHGPARSRSVLRCALLQAVARSPNTSSAWPCSASSAATGSTASPSASAPLRWNVGAIRRCAASSTSGAVTA